MKTVIQFFLVTTFCTCGSLARGAEVPLSVKDTNEVQQALSGFDKNILTLEQVTEKGGAEWGGKILDYYLSHSNEVTLKMKLPISRCFAAFGKYPEAAELARDYVNVYSNDWRGWDILGGAKLMMGSHGEALWAMTNAVRLGDKKNYPSLGAAALATDRLDVFQEMVLQPLLTLKRAKETPKTDRLDLVGMLLVYGLKTDQKDVFVKALDGISAAEIIDRDDIKELVEKGCKQFTAKETKTLCDKIAEAGGIQSRTNRKDR